MLKQLKLLTLIILFTFVFVWTGIAQEQADETVVCPVSGKEVKKSEAVGPYELKGHTFYFCCEGCKEKFIKNPEKYLHKKAEKKEESTCSLHKKAESEKACCDSDCMMLMKKMMKMMHMHGKHQKHGHMLHEKAEKTCCPLMGFEDTDVKIEKLEDGVVVKITSKNADVVKKIQETVANLKAGTCCEKEDVVIKKKKSVEKK